MSIVFLQSGGLSQAQINQVRLDRRLLATALRAFSARLVAFFGGTP